MRLQNRLPISHATANALLDLRKTPENCEKLGALSSIIKSESGPAKSVSMRDFKRFKASVVDDYLTKVDLLKAEMRKRDRHKAAAQFDLFNMYLLIGQKLDVDFSGCQD